MKSNRQKCLEMWQWLAQNPSKDKTDYEIYMIENDEVYNSCWACVEAVNKTDDVINSCRFCPIDFPGKSCHNRLSPYRLWYEAQRIQDFESAGYAALEMVRLIGDTWIED